MEKIKIFFFFNLLQINDFNSINFKEIKNNIITKYKNLNEKKLFKYGKYILLIPIIYYPIKKIIINEINGIKNN